MHLKILFGIWWPFCLAHNVFKPVSNHAHAKANPTDHDELQITSCQYRYIKLNAKTFDQFWGWWRYIDKLCFNSFLAAFIYHFNNDDPALVIGSKLAFLHGVVCRSDMRNSHFVNFRIYMSLGTYCIFWVCSLWSSYSIIAVEDWRGVTTLSLKHVLENWYWMIDYVDALSTISLFYSFVL